MIKDNKFFLTIEIKESDFFIYLDNKSILVKVKIIVIRFVLKLLLKKVKIYENRGSYKYYLKMTKV